MRLILMDGFRTTNFWQRDKGQGIALVRNNSAIRYISSEDSSNGMCDRETDSFIIYGC